MPQLDFREALSTPEQEVVNEHPAIWPNATAAAIIPTENAKGFSNDTVGFSRSTWANVVFVTIASVGALFCAFYFFNGAQLLRAAAAWPGEFLYPRPMDDNIGIEQPNVVDRYSRTTSDSRKSKDAPFDRNYFPSSLTQPGSNLGAFNAGGFDLSNPGAAPFSSVSLPITQLNFLPPGADSIFQSFYQRALALVPKPGQGIVGNTVSSTRRKLSTAHQTINREIKSTVRTTNTSASTAANALNTATRSSTQTAQQTATQMNGSLNSQGPSGLSIGRTTGVSGMTSGVSGITGSLGGAVRGLGGRH